MDTFEPAPHHRRLTLQLKPNVSLPKSDPRPTPIGHQHLEREFTSLLLKQGRIAPSNSPVGAPMLFVVKPKKSPTEPTRCLGFCKRRGTIDNVFMRKDTCMPGFHNHYTCMPGVNSYSMPGLANCDTGHKALCPVSPVLNT